MDYLLNSFFLICNSELIKFIYYVSSCSNKARAIDYLFLYGKIEKKTKKQKKHSLV